MELRSFKKLSQIEVDASGEDCGDVFDFYFQDNNWVIRYVVVDTGNWFQSENVLISPLSIKRFSWDADKIAVDLKPDQIKSAPSFNMDKPISRQFEINYFNHYQYPAYWTGKSLWGESFYPEEAIRLKYKPLHIAANLSDPHLRSAKEVRGYRINSLKDDSSPFGHVEDFLFDIETWTLRYFVIDTTNFLPGKKVLISPEWVDSINWEQDEFNVNILKAAIKSAPSYEDGRAPTREDELAIHNYFGRPPYWSALPERRHHPAA